MLTQIDEYVKHKTWYWYVPVWLFGLFVFVQVLHFEPNSQLPFPIMLAQSFDFFLHEMAHIFTGFLPAILTAASGSVSELLLGSGLIVVAFMTRGYFSVMICSLWFMLTCESAGAYMADAVPQRIQLVSLGGAMSGSDKVIHDWNFIFGKLHMLGVSELVGDIVKFAGVIVGLAGLGFAAWLIYKMAAAKDQQAVPLSKRPPLKSMSLPTAMDPLEPHAQQTKSIYPTPERGPMARSSSPKESDVRGDSDDAGGANSVPPTQKDPS